MTAKLESLTSQMKALKLKLAQERAKALEDSRMKPEAFKEAIAKLGLNQKQAGVFFGCSTRQGQRWALGEAPVPTGVVIALALMIKYKKKPEDFDEMLAIVNAAE